MAYITYEPAKHPFSLKVTKALLQNPHFTFLQTRRCITNQSIPCSLLQPHSQDLFSTRAMSVRDFYFLALLLSQSPRVILVSHKPAQWTLPHRDTISTSGTGLQSMKMVGTDSEWRSRVRGVRVTASSGCCPSPDPQKSHTPLVLKTN